MLSDIIAVVCGALLMSLVIAVTLGVYETGKDDWGDRWNDE